MVNSTPSLSSVLWGKYLKGCALDYWLHKWKTILSVLSILPNSTVTRISLHLLSSRLILDPGNELLMEFVPGLFVWVMTIWLPIWSKRLCLGQEVCAWVSALFCIRFMVYMICVWGFGSVRSCLYVSSCVMTLTLGLAGWLTVPCSKTGSMSYRHRIHRCTHWDINKIGRFIS